MHEDWWGPPPVQKSGEAPSSVILELLGDELTSLENDFDCDGPESAHQEMSNGNVFYAFQHVT